MGHDVQTGNLPVSSSRGDAPEARHGHSRREFLRRGAFGVGGIALAGGLSAVLEACAPSQGSPIATSEPTSAPPTAAPSVGTTTITLGSWFWTEAGRAEAWRYVVDQFHKTQDAIRVKEAGGPFGEFTQNIVVQLQSGRLESDLIQTTPELFIPLVRAGQLEPLDEVVSAAGIGKLSGAHDFMRVDGKLYGLDAVTVPIMSIYNKRIFSDSGVSQPNTVDEWLDGARQLTDRAKNKFGFFTAHTPPEAGLVWAYHAGIVLPFDGIWADGKKPLLTSDPVIRGLKLFQSFYQDAIPQGTDDPTGLQLLGKGQVAQDYAATAILNVLKANPAEYPTYPDLNTMVPPWKSRRTLIRSHPITVNAQSERKEAAKTFLEFAYSQDVYPELFKRSLDVYPAYDAPGVQGYLSELPWREGVLAMQPVSPTELIGDFVEVNNEFGQIIMSHFLGALQTGQAVEEAMAIAQTEAEALASRSFS